MKEYLQELIARVMEVYEDTPRFWYGYRNLLDEYYDKRCDTSLDDFDYAISIQLQEDIMKGGDELKQIINNVSMAIARVWKCDSNIQTIERYRSVKYELKRLLVDDEERRKLWL